MLYIRLQPGPVHIAGALNTCDTSVQHLGREPQAADWELLIWVAHILALQLSLHLYHAPLWAAVVARDGENKHGCVIVCVTQSQMLYQGQRSACQVCKMAFESKIALTPGRVVWSHQLFYALMPLIMWLRHQQKPARLCRA